MLKAKNHFKVLIAHALSVTGEMAPSGATPLWLEGKYGAWISNLGLAIALGALDQDLGQTF